MATGDGEKMDEKYQGSGAAGSGDNRRIYAINSTNVRYICSVLNENSICFKPHTWNEILNVTMKIYLVLGQNNSFNSEEKSNRFYWTRDENI